MPVYNPHQPLEDQIDLHTGKGVEDPMFRSTFMPYVEQLLWDYEQGVTKDPPSQASIEALRICENYQENLFKNAGQLRGFNYGSYEDDDSSSGINLQVILPPTLIVITLVLMVIFARNNPTARNLGSSISISATNIGQTIQDYELPDQLPFEFGSDQAKEADQVPTANVIDLQPSSELIHVRPLIPVETYDRADVVGVSTKYILGEHELERFIEVISQEFEFSEYALANLREIVKLANSEASFSEGGTVANPLLVWYITGAVQGASELFYEINSLSAHNPGMKLPELIELVCSGNSAELVNRDICTDPALYSEAIYQSLRKDIQRLNEMRSQ